VNTDARPIPARALVHQEGVLGLLALLGLGLRESGPLDALRPAAGSVSLSLAAGAVGGLAMAGLLWLLRRLPALRTLERWQRVVVGGWEGADAAAVAVISGLAEEALLRALLQPVIGLLPAALLFAVLHVIPDRRLWMWPVLALFLGVGLGLLFEHFGYPAAALAHGLLNWISLHRLRQPMDA
jgi:hypothetical protein